MTPPVGSFRERKFCALCESTALRIALTLPATPLANEFVSVSKRATPQEVFPLDLVLCMDCGHLQMNTIVDPERLFRNYVYVTGTSPVTRRHLADYAATMTNRFLRSLDKRPFIVEIGSNDGTLLKEFQDRGQVRPRILGVDPAKAVALAAAKDGVPTIDTFFTPSVAKEIVHECGRADLVVANNVLAHAEDIRSILAGVKILLGPDGVLVFEVSYLGDVLDEMAFDTIYHEHYSYHALSPLVRACESLGLYIFDAEYTAGQLGRGSMRVYARWKDCTVSPAVERVVGEEQALGIFKLDTYERYGQEIERRRRHFMGTLEGLRGSLMGYGAPAKLTTLMYTYMIGDEFTHVVDDSPWKQNLYTPGKHIPVLAPSPEHTGDVCVVFAWNFAESIIAKCRAAGWKSKFVVPLPEVRVV